MMCTAAVLELLVEEQRAWSIEELAREIGDRVRTLDAVAQLERSGLLNRLNERFVCASRAAIAAEQISRGEL
jgi:hypothetical protein